MINSCSQIRRAHHALCVYVTAPPNETEWAGAPKLNCLTRRTIKHNEYG